MTFGIHSFIEIRSNFKLTKAIVVSCERRAQVPLRGLSVEDARLVGRDHVLDVDEGVLAAVGLEHLEGLLDEIAQNEALALRVLDLVADVGVRLLEQVHHGQDLAVVGHESLADSVGARHERLQDLQGDSDDLRVAGVKGSYLNHGVTVIV